VPCTASVYTSRTDLIPTPDQARFLAAIQCVRAARHLIRRCATAAASGCRISALGADAQPPGRARLPDLLTSAGLVE
jgi:hypothetical protein